MIGRTLVTDWPELIARLVEESEVVAMALIGPDDTVRACNRGLRSALQVDEPPLGERIDTYFESVGDAPWLETPSSGHSPRPNALRTTTGETLWAIVYRLGDVRLLVAERLGRSDDEVVADLSRMTGYLAGLSHQLRQKTTALEDANRRIVELTRRDPLTGLYNRRFLDEILPLRIAEAHRHRQPLALVLADIDRFKAVNDTLGHEGGDRALRAVADVLHSNSRAEDLPVRYGGEEFLLVLPQTDLRGALDCAERIRTTVSALRFLPDDREITLSAGVTALAPDDDPSALVRRADRALYTAKDAGRDRCCSAVA